MKLLYKTVMFLTLLIFCIGSVCATDPNNTTSDSMNDYNTIRASVDRLEANDVTQTNMINELNTTVNNQAIKINELNTTVNDLKEDNKALREDNKALREDNKALNSKVDNQSVTINNLKSDNEALKDNNTQLDKRVKDLEYSKLTQSNRIKSLEIDIKNLEDSNKVLNVKIDNQSVIISELNSKIDNLKLENENFKNKRIEILENLTYANVKLRELELNNNSQVAEIQKLKDTIKNLTNENNRLKAINNDLKAKQVSYADVHNAIKTLDTYIKKHKKAPDTVKCGGKSFKLNDFLKLELVKDGKERALLFKKKTGNLPNYTVVASYQLDLNIYKKLYNL